jgi:F-type H+-transporting ATPase subunit b
MLNALVAYAAEEGAAEAHNPLIPAWYDIIWSSVCFIVILIIFWKVALPRMKKLLDERSAAIEGNIAKADEAQRKAEAALEEYTAQLADARKEAGEIRDAAREDGRKIVAEAKENASAEATRLTTTAHAQIEAERQTALVSLRSEVGTLALDLAGGVIGESLSDDAKAQAVVDRFLADLEASEAEAARQAQGPRA